jgi:hypothetical protein
MSAQTAAQLKRQLGQLRKKHPAVAALLGREEPLVDAAFTSRSSEVHIRTGTLDDSVNAEVQLYLEDHRARKVAYPISVYWKMFRFKRGKEGFERIELHDSPHSDMNFALDEIEAFATALYQAVQLAKNAGHLPSEA